MNKYDFESFVDNPEWNETNNIYLKNKGVIDILIDSFSKKYNFPKDDVKNSFIHEIMSFQYNQSKLNLFKGKVNLKYLVMYMAIMAIFVLFLPISLILNIFSKTKKFDVVFEEMWDRNSWYKRFYNYIDKQLDKSLNRVILFSSMNPKKIYNKDAVELWDGETIDIRSKNRYFDFYVILQVVLKDFLYIFTLYKLSKQSNLNIVFLYLSLIRRYVLYSSQVSKVEAKVLISAGDYYWNPLKYLCYKKNIEQIMLIQHNNKDNYLFGRLFPYCDHYFAHSKDALSKIEGIAFAKKQSVGSLQLIPFLDKKEISYDILFINQTVYDKALKDNSPNLDVDRLIKQHEIFIENFKSYLEKNKDLKVLYICKPGYLDIKPAILVNKKFENIPNIKFIEAYGKEMFDYISSSKLLLNMYSSVGKEAYGLDKKVLWINYEHCCDIFEFDTEIEDLHIMINDNSYSAFEIKIDFLLSKSQEADEHYKELKKQYMNIQENPAKIIAQKINKIIKKD